jgi:molecular chaperone Hsp33
MIKQDIFKGQLKQQLKASARDRLYRFILADGMIRGAIVKTTRMVNEMRANHGLGGLETLVLGQAYIAAALLTANLKSRDRISLTVKCSGPIKGFDVESNMFGEVRGYLKAPGFSSHVDPEATTLSSLFGAGFLTVTKYLEEAKHPYSGQVVLEYGTLAEDLANYFLTSEQTPTAFNLSVHFDGSGEVTGAGGLFLQAMPGADDETVAKAQAMIKDIDSIGRAFAENQEPDTLVNVNFQDLNPVLLDGHRVEFFCRCSEKKMNEHLAFLPRKDITDILDNGPFPVELRCHNCNSVYLFDRQDIEKLQKNTK